MKIGSLFAGIGGLELGLEWAGLGEVAWQVEIDPYRRSILQRHWPEAKRHADIKAFHPSTKVDLICGGFPCQDISPAGKRVGLTGERSGLWYEMFRVIGEARPGWVVVENSGHRWRAWVPSVRRSLWSLGYSSVPIRVRASEVGAWHERSRVFVVADADGAILRLQRGGCGRTQWQATLESAIAGARGPATDAAEDRRGQRWARGLASGVVGAPDEALSGDANKARCHARSGAYQWTRTPALGVGWWSTEPDMVRMVHGLSGRVDRVAALGDSVVPQVAMAVGLFVRELLL